MEAIIRNGHPEEKLVQDKHQRPCLGILGHDTQDTLDRGNLTNLDEKLQTISMMQLNSKGRKIKAGKEAQSGKKRISSKSQSST